MFQRLFAHAFRARRDRTAELPDFLDALFNEWGEEDMDLAAAQIIAFLQDRAGLEQYREAYGLPEDTPAIRASLVQGRAAA